MKNLELTQLENNTVTELKNHLDVYFDKDGNVESYFSSAEVEDLSKGANIPMSKLRGVVSSLIKKDVIYLDDVDDDGTELVYINENLLNLFF